MSQFLPRVVPTLTEVLDEAAWRSEPVAAPLAEPEPAPEREAEPLDASDFDLDLGEALTEPAQPAAPPVAASDELLNALEIGLRQRLGMALDLAVDELLQQRLRASLERAAAQLTESVLQELRQQLAPQLEQLLQQALSDVMRRERDRLAG